MAVDVVNVLDVLSMLSTPDDGEDSVMSLCVPDNPKLFGWIWIKFLH